MTQFLLFLILLALVLVYWHEMGIALQKIGVWLGSDDARHIALWVGVICFGLGVSYEVHKFKSRNIR